MRTFDHAVKPGNQPEGDLDSQNQTTAFSHKTRESDSGEL
jgi:hypothetical protein